jgi:D-beta-D-heptose 7-phosphate kinase/D-beta-D-heptose 1-phosphate adenosyltransferase
MDKKIIGIVSGYFNPLHVGHIDYLNAAKKACKYLVCIINNDDQVKLKGSQPFMNESDRAKIIVHLEMVDNAMISIDTDSSVAKTLQLIVDTAMSQTACKDFDMSQIEFVFFNSGDRNPSNENEKEVYVCEKNNITRQFIDLPKVCSSSELKRNLTSKNVE